MKKDFREAMEKRFAFYGFTAFPFSETEFHSFYLVHGADEEKAFSVGSDLAAGFGFAEAMRASCDWGD